MKCYVVRWLVLYLKIALFFRRQRERERKKKRKAEAKERGEIPDGSSRKRLKLSTMKGSSCHIRVAIDVSFDHLMSDHVIRIGVRRLPVLPNGVLSYSLNFRIYRNSVNKFNDVTQLIEEWLHHYRYVFTYMICCRKKCVNLSNLQSIDSIVTHFE